MSKPQVADQESSAEPPAPSHSESAPESAPAADRATEEPASVAGGKKNDQKNDESGGDTRDDTEDEQAASADKVQEKATDTDEARQWTSADHAMDAAFDDLIGGRFSAAGPSYYIRADTIGRIGDQFGGAGATESVRTGPVPQQVLHGIEQFFVRPSGYVTARDSLRRHQLLLLRDRGGTGRTTAALHLLSQECRAGVQKLDPDTELKSLRAEDLQPNQGYLLDSLEPQQAMALGAFHAERIVGLLNERASRLVVLVDPATPLRLDEVSHLVVDDLGAAEPAQVLRSHVAFGLRESAEDADQLLGRPDVVEFVDQLPPDLPRRDLVTLASLLVSVATGRTTLDAVRGRFSRIGDTSFTEWFSRQAELEQKAFVIALAVFNGESVRLVSAAARLLADQMLTVEIPRRADRGRPVFDTPLDTRIEQAKAELVEAVRDTRFGKIMVKVVRFRDESFPRRILEHVCDQYDHAAELVQNWLLELGVIPGDTVLVRAGMAAGLLTLGRFDFMYDAVILPWAAGGDPEARMAAVSALRIPSRDPLLAPVVSRMLRSWIRQRDKPWLRVTAALALGNTDAMSPKAALRLWRVAARRADWELAFQIAQGVRSMFRRGEATEPILRALLSWTDDDEPPRRRETALLTVLVLANYLVVDVDHSVESWPALIWLATEDVNHRAQIVTLFSRMLVAANFMRRGYLQLRGWLKEAQREKSLREPVAELLADIAEMSGEAESLRYYLNHWNSERQPPADAIRVVQNYFDLKGI